MAAREQLGLRQQLSARQARVQELKGALDSKNKTIEELRRRLEASPLHGRGNSGSRNSPSGKARKKTLALPHTPASPPESVPAEWAVERDDIERFELSLTEGSALLHAEVSSRGEPGLVGQIASLRAELAHRDALVSQLESKLLEALSASRREGEGEAARERDSLKQEAAAALRTAAAVLGGREMAPTIVAAVAALAARLKAAEATTLRSSGGLAPLEAPALTSLEASQRAVIRSLSKRNAVVEGREAAARSDRDRLRSRLDALHNSTGGDVDRDPRPDEEAVSPWGSPEVASVANGDAVAALGMLRLLMHHIAAVRAAARSTAPPDSDAIQQEAASMMATVDVLAAEILQLSKQLVASSGGAPTQDASKDPKDASGSGMQVAVAESWKQRALAAESSLLDVRKQEPAAAQMRQMVVDLQHQVDESEARVEELQQQLAAAAEPPPEGSRGILQLVEWQRKAERAERRVGELEKQILLVPKPGRSASCRLSSLITARVVLTIPCFSLRCGMQSHPNLKQQMCAMPGVPSLISLSAECAFA